jgi:copper chaperone
MEKAYFKVIGMYCISCKSLIEKQLKDESGVRRIDVDYMTDSVVVEFDPSIITKEEIKDRLEKSGIFHWRYKIFILNIMLPKMVYLD